MSFRRTGQRDDRRRRVLNETVSYRQAVAARDWADRERPEHKSAHYGDASFLNEQPRLTDLAPKRPITFIALFVVGCVVIAGLLGCYYATSQKLAESSTDGSIAAFDLDGEGSLAVWFSSFLLLLASFTALLVYSVRRFRTDDYNGNYRIWLWAALCWLVMSIDETSSLHEGFKEGMALFTGTRIMGDGSMWWVMAYFFVLAPVGIRLLLDMRESKLSLGSFLCVAFCYVSAVAAQLGIFLPTESHTAIMIEEGAEMLGNLFLLTAMALYLRHVVADAEGLLPNVTKNETEETDEAEEEYYHEEEEDEYDIDEEREAALLEKARTIRIASAKPKPTKKPYQQSPKTTTGPSTIEFTSIAEAEDYYGRKLTKQEKKRIRRQITKQRNRAG